ncbi:MAG: DNA starvation/stationary phase protection protein [Gammaproteobacteria bacterium]|nr:MAG: DNA starvation/stationary phase protection protein [Gammaproteobacteria bacterium]
MTNKVVDGLSHLLADTYVLYVKTQNFHWNIRGPHFFDYHKMLEAQYEALAEATDVLAERIRALQALAPASMGQFLKLTSLKEAGNDLKAEVMIKLLLADHEAVGKMIEGLFLVVEKSGDEVTMDLLIQRKTEHDKMAWMLRSIVG